MKQNQEVTTYHVTAPEGIMERNQARLEQWGAGMAPAFYKAVKEVSDKAAEYDVSREFTPDVVADRLATMVEVLSDLDADESKLEPIVKTWQRANDLIQDRPRLGDEIAELEAVVRAQVDRDVLALAVGEMPQAVGDLMKGYVDESYRPKGERDREQMAYLLRATDEAAHLALLVSGGLGAASVMAGGGSDQISEGQFQRLRDSALFACNLPEGDSVQGREFIRQRVLQTPWGRLKRAAGLIT